MGSTLAEAVCSKNQNVIKILKLKPFAILMSIDIVVSVKSLTAIPYREVQGNTGKTL